MVSFHMRLGSLVDRVQTSICLLRILHALKLPEQLTESGSWPMGGNSSLVSTHVDEHVWNGLTCAYAEFGMGWCCTGVLAGCKRLRQIWITLSLPEITIIINNSCVNMCRCFVPPGFCAELISSGEKMYPGTLNFHFETGECCMVPAIRGVSPIHGLSAHSEHV